MVVRARSVEIDVVFEWHAAGVNFENAEATVASRQIDGDVSVEATGAEECRIEHVAAVGGSQHDHGFALLEAVHFAEDLIECLFAFIVATADTGTADAAHGVDLVNEDDAGAASRAVLKRSRTRVAPTPTNI
jgi:hypothetical protein